MNKQKSQVLNFEWNRASNLNLCIKVWKLNICIHKQNTTIYIRIYLNGNCLRFVQAWKLIEYEIVDYNIVKRHTQFWKY